MDILLFIILITISLILWNAVNGRLARSFYGMILLIWIIPLGISLMNPFGLNDVSDNVYLIVTSGLLSFGVGYIILNKPIRCLRITNIRNEINWLSSIKFIRITFLGCLILLCYLAITQWRLIMLQGGMGNLKLDFFELIFDNNSGLFFIYQAIVIPLFYISCMVFACMILNGDFSKTMISLFLYIFIFSFVGGKRGYFSIFLQYFIIGYLAKRFAKSTIHTKIKANTWLKILSIGGLAFFGAAYVTTVGNNGSEFKKSDFSKAALENVENVIVYQIGPYRALDYALNHDYIEKYGGYTLGRSTIGGMFDYYGCGILNIIGIPIQRSRDLSMNPLQTNSIIIGKGRSWNFSYTSFYYFIFDFGWPGILLFSFLFGILVRFSINLYDKTATVGSLCLMGYMFIGCALFNASWFNISLYTQPLILICLSLSYFELKKRPKWISK